MSDDTRQPEASVLRDAIIREGVGLAVLAAVLWYLGPGKLMISGLVHRAKTSMGVRDRAIDVQVGQFRAEVSRWDHEQAARKANPPAAGGCGC